METQKVAVVTGASQGIGLATVQRLLADGYQVYAQYNSTSNALEHECLQWFQADFTAPDKLSEFLPAELLEAEQVHVLVHCAGVAHLGPCAQTSAAIWQEHMNVNVIAPAMLTTALLPQLRAGQANVVVVNSGAGHHTHPRWGAYSASKHAAKAWANALRQEEPELRVSSIYPGRVATQMQAAIHEYEQRAYDPTRYIQPDSVARTIMQAIQLPTDAGWNDIDIRPRS